MSLKSRSALVAVVLCLCAAGFAQNIQSRHVVVVMEENRSVSEASEYMPYLKSLAEQYSQGMQVYSDSHGSWLAYGELTSGFAPFNGEAVNGICTGDGCSQTITIDNLVRRFASQGISWRGYFQSLPETGYLGYESGMYVRRHNPFAFYSDVVNSSTEQENIVPLDGYLLPDIQSNKLANFTWITPDLTHDAHNGDNDQDALAAADAYLQTFLPQLLQSPPFQPGGDGVLLITFDEGELAGDNQCGGQPDANNCGGHIWQVLIGPQVRHAYQSENVYKQGSQLRMFCDLLGLNSCPGDGATSRSMSEFFQASVAAVTITSPTPGETTASPVNVVASGTGASSTVNHLELWIDGEKIGNYAGATMNANVPLANGAHSLTVVEVDSTGAYLKSTPVDFTVERATIDEPGNCAAPSSAGVTVCSPAPGQTVTSPVTFLATGRGASGDVNHLELWIDGNKIGNYSGASMNANVTLPAGSHTATVVEVDSQLHYVKSIPVNFTVDACAAGADKTVAICSVQGNESTGSPVQIVAAAKDNEHPITGMVAYANSQIVAQSSNATLNASVPLNPGQYQLVIRAWDSTGYYFSSQENFTVK